MVETLLVAAFGECYVFVIVSLFLLERFLLTMEAHAFVHFFFQRRFQFVSVSWCMMSLGGLFPVSIFISNPSNKTPFGSFRGFRFLVK